MPAKNRIKQYLADGYYHIYNRGVEKRKIFIDEQDYKVFLTYLKNYLEPIDQKAIWAEIEKTHYLLRDKLFNKLQMNNYTDKIQLFCFCLMPNHFHLLLKQKNERGIEEFMRSLGTRYVMYFNKKYKRTGGLFQGRYKAVLVKTDEQLLHLSRYIHLNPKHKGPALPDRPEKSYSSLPFYLGKQGIKWLQADQILSFFSKTNKNSSYKSFVMSSMVGNEEIDNSIKSLVME